jgi:hypothetical protein
MAFQHFHRHYKKYMVVFFIATLFSLFTFNITSAILQAFGSVVGATSGAAMRFTTTDGTKVGLSFDDMRTQEVQVKGFVELLESLGFPVALTRESRNAWLPHVILLAEADRLGIQIPDDPVNRMVDFLKQIVARRLRGDPRNPHVVTESEYGQILRRNNLTEASLFERMREWLKIQAYIRTMSGTEIQNPEDVIECFQAKHERVTLEYVACSFDHFKEELKKSPPSDADLETWFKALPAAVVNLKYMREERFDIDLLTIDGDAFDASKVDPEILGTVADPTDDEILSEARRDPIRYTGGKPVEKAADVDAAGREKIARDRKLKIVVDKAKAEFERTVNELPPVDDKLPDEEKQKAAADRKTKEREAFAQVGKKYGFTFAHFDDQTPKQIEELDPPKTSMLHNLLNGVKVPTIVHSCSFLPSRDVKFAFMARVDEWRKAEPKSFAEAKESALEQWIDEQSKVKAAQAAQAFLDAVVEKARAGVPAERLAAIDQQRDDALKKLDVEKDVADEAKKARREAIHDRWVDNVQAAIGADVSKPFGEVARAQGLEAVKIGPQRRSVMASPFFKDRFSGAERFLWSQNSNGFGTAKLLSFGTGMMSGVLVDEEDKLCVVARVVARERPKVEEMAPRDRDEAERDNRRWMVERQNVPYSNPFSFSALVARHKPEQLVSHHKGDQGYSY